MFAASLLLVLLIVTTPAIIIFDGPIIHGLVTLVAAVSVAIVALRIRPGEAGFLSTIFRPVAIVAAVPAFWMVIQVLPLKSLGLAHPIWESAAAALGRPLAGSISIDPGATVISLARYLSTVAIAFVAAAVAIDRHRAGWILFALTVATTSIALMLLANIFGGFTLLDNNDGGLTSDAARHCAGLGVILSAAATLHTIENGKARARGQGGSAVWFWLTFAVSFVAFAICCLAVIVDTTYQTIFSVACGITTLAIAIFIRRFLLGPWGYSAIVSVALVIAIIAVVNWPDDRNAGLLLAFATQSPAPLVALTQRVLTETNWAGTGAGTFAALLPIYRGIDELGTSSVPPTAVAAMAVEMGRPFLVAVLIAAIALFVKLLGGALRRGRDAVYSMTGASCIVTITLLTFSSAALFSTPVSVITAAVFGIAIAQSKSRSIQ